MRLLLLSIIFVSVSSFTISGQRQNSMKLFRQRSDQDEAALLEQEETPAGVAGAEFFGGNKQKEELYDPVAEAQADLIIDYDAEGMYNRFDDSQAFDDDSSKTVAQSLQSQVNRILYSDSNGTTTTEYTYAPNVQWESPFATGGASSPLAQLETALDFYNRLDLAIISSKQIDGDKIRLRWEISVEWPIFWQARVVLTGTSTLTIDENNRIQKQVDTLDQKDLIATIASQVLPRFWDTYHIGMTPSAEKVPKVPMESGLLPKSYQISELMPRLVYKATLLDTGSREDAYAQVMPNHAFCTVIKTMGPQRQRYVTTSPVEVQLKRSGDEQVISWGIPISVELLSRSSELPLPGEDPETPETQQPTASYEFSQKRRVATVPYGGNPQDAEVANVRKKLYESVVKDGHTPKLDPDTGRPQFFFWQNDAKACYTQDGLGMGVYDWRPKSVKANEVGIELEVPKDNAIARDA